MSADYISKAKEADETFNLLVSSYMRNTSNSKEIPDLITSITTSYCMDLEYFRKYFEKPGQNIEITQDKLSIRVKKVSGSKECSHNTIYCKRWISSTSNLTVTWAFKVDRFDKGSCISIGIANQNNYQHDRHKKKFSDAHNYVVWTSKYSTRGLDLRRLKLGTNNTVSYILNLKHRNIKVLVNGKKRAGWSNINISSNIKYKFAVELIGRGTKITLIPVIKNESL